MTDKIIWKVLLMVGGLIGGIYCCPKFVEACTNWQDCLNDNYSAFLGPWIEEYQSDAIIFGIFSVVCVAAFIIGCFISTNNEQDNTQHTSSDSNEESN